MYAVVFLVLGVAVGTVARMFARDGRESGAWLASALMGVAGALAGGLLGRALGGLLPVGGDPALAAGFIAALLGALLVVSVHDVVARARRIAGRLP